MYLLYSALAAVALVLALPVLLLRMVRHGKYRAGLGERFGRFVRRLRDPHRRPTIWVHAVSVGETLAVSGLISELRRIAPAHRVVVSTTTMTGQKLARQRFGEANVFYFPVDFACAIRPYLRELRPELVVLAEAEFWPNFLRLAHQSGARIAVVNARISDRSFPRYRRFRSVVGPVLSHVDLFLAQGEEDRRRLIEIGAPAERVQVSGNMKFDIAPAAFSPLAEQIRSAVTGWVLVCGSTVEGEERLLINTMTRVWERFPEAVMVLAPRHPERFAEVNELLAASGVPFLRRSQWNGEPLGGKVFLLDTIGELTDLYEAADLAFVGGSLVPRGGHNILEPARCGVATIVGPYTENFRDIIQAFLAAEAVQVTDAEHLTETIMYWLTHDSYRRGMGDFAKQTIAANSGATARTVAALESLLGWRNAASPERVAVSKLSPPES
jgi:3-deoxy-D-manno-octulosonic-acid transferase